jgi:hypothetical protein
MAVTQQIHLHSVLNGPQVAQVPLSSRARFRRQAMIVRRPEHLFDESSHRLLLGWAALGHGART